MKLDLYPLKLYFKKLYIGGFFGAGLLVNIGIWLTLWWKMAGTEGDIFLHYNILFGVDLIGPVWKVYLVPILGLVILIINFLIGWFFYKQDKFIAQIMNFVGLLGQIFLVIVAALLIFLNT